MTPNMQSRIDKIKYCICCALTDTKTVETDANDTPSEASSVSDVDDGWDDPLATYNDDDDVDSDAENFIVDETESSFPGVSQVAQGPPDISQTISDAPAQPRLSRYPTKLQAGAKRSFHSAWYTGNNWLEYSQQEDAAFCYACRHFAVPGSNPDKAFTTVGYSNWKKSHVQRWWLFIALQSRLSC